jgi:lipoprotein-releasing system permease protein
VAHLRTFKRNPPALSYELFIGLRYTRAKRRNHFISFISLISMGGIALGVMALIVVLSVMNGFQYEIRSRILSVASHVQIASLDNRLLDWQGVAAQAGKHPQVLAAAPFINAQGMLSHEGTVRGAVVRGIDPNLENNVAEIGRHMSTGTMQLVPGEFGIVLGRDLAHLLGAFPGDQVTVIAPQGLVTPAGMIPRLKQFRVVGTFEVGHAEFDSSLALIHIADAQRLYQMGDAVSGVRLKLQDLFQAPLVAEELAVQFGNDIYVGNWTRQFYSFFRAVEIEKRMMFIILTLIIAVAAFNVVSTLVMVVTDKQSDIAILRTLGASPGSILKIFMVQGTIIGVIGTLLGVILGVAIALNIDVLVPALETALNLKFLSKDVYMIPELPSDVHWDDVGVIAGISLLLSFFAGLYPSWRAARVRPAEALRYE